MEIQLRSRYVLAVYLVVLSLAVILILASLFFTTSPDWMSVWINLGTSLLGVVVLFFVANDDRFQKWQEVAGKYPWSRRLCVQASAKICSDREGGPS